MSVVPLQVDGHEATILDALGRWAATFVAAVGAGVLRELTSFSRAARPGSMITIKCTRDGFTAQVTGSIVGGRPLPLTAAEVAAIVDDIEGARS